MIDVFVTKLLPRDGDMAEDHGTLEAEHLPRAWARGWGETQSLQRASGAKNP